MPIAILSKKKSTSKKQNDAKTPYKLNLNCFKVTLRTMKFIKLLTLYLKFPQPSVPYCWMTGSYFFDFTSSEKNTICWNLFCCRIFKLRLFFHEINIFQYFSSIQFNHKYPLWMNPRQICSQFYCLHQFIF